MRIKINIAPLQAEIFESSYNFIPGRLYRCVKASEFHPLWLGCIAWKQRNESISLGLKANRVYAVRNDSNIIEKGYEFGLDFSYSYHFELLPPGSSIEVIQQVTTEKVSRLP